VPQACAKWCRVCGVKVGQSSGGVRWCIGDLLGVLLAQRGDKAHQHTEALETAQGPLVRRRLGQGPVGRDQLGGPVGDADDKMAFAVLRELAHDRERLPRQRMMGGRNHDALEIR
jgi:hypothetical protein